MHRSNTGFKIDLTDHGCFHASRRLLSIKHCKTRFVHRRTPRSYCDTSEPCLHSLCIMPSNQIRMRRLEIFESHDATLWYSFPVQFCLVMTTLDRLLGCKIMHVIRSVLVTSARRERRDKQDIKRVVSPYNIVTT
jgi:hypothetical protein